MTGADARLCMRNVSKLGNKKCSWEKQPYLNDNGDAKLNESRQSGKVLLQLHRGEANQSRVGEHSDNGKTLEDRQPRRA